MSVGRTSDGAQRARHSRSLAGRQVSRAFLSPDLRVRGCLRVSGTTGGHSSNYAAIKIVAAPASELSLNSAAIYPASVSVSYAQKLLVAVGRAAVDELFPATWYPYRGCSLIVREVGWDEIMSSEVAIYRAARGAFAKLREEGQWTLAS